MKPNITFISRLAICAVAGGLAVTTVNAQTDPGEGNTDTGGDVSGHNTIDSPYLRPKPKPAQSAASKSLSQKDQKFLSQIAAGGIQAVQDAKTAEKQGNDATKKVASRIAAERGNSNKELMALTKKKGLTLGVDKIKARNMGKENFDKQYIRTTGADLQADAKLLQTAAQSSDDKDVKSWAAKTLPMVKGHLAMVKSVK